MPVSSFFGLQTSLRGLLAQQRALDVTGHNITNAGTEGFSRQEAVLAATGAMRLGGGAIQGGQGADLGSGVDVLAYRRLRDRFLDQQWRGQSTVLGGQAATTRGLERAELALAEPGERGLAHLFGEFWGAWSDVANAPESEPARQALVEAGLSLTSAMKQLDSQLQVVGDDAQAEYDALIGPGGEVDSLAQDIAALNRGIRESVQAGVEPNDLYDRRDLLLDRLSALGTVGLTPLAGGDLQVTLGGEMVVNSDTPLLPATYTAPGGRLGALQRIVDTTIPSYRAALNGVAESLHDTVNAAHPGFFTGSGPAWSTTIDVGVTPATMTPGSTGERGANQRALLAAALRGGDAESRYDAFVTRVGADVRGARRAEANAEALVDAVSDRREAVFGVSMDEEMTNLVRFQRGYQAAARALSTFDEILDVLINRTGRVGL